MIIRTDRPEGLNLSSFKFEAFNEPWFTFLQRPACALQSLSQLAEKERTIGLVLMPALARLKGHVSMWAGGKRQESRGSLSWVKNVLVFAHMYALVLFCLGKSSLSGAFYVFSLEHSPPAEREIIPIPHPTLKTQCSVRPPSPSSV